MKKFLGLTLMLMFIASNCFAMTFSQPVKIGSIGHYFQSPWEGLPISGESYNSGKPHNERRKLSDGTSAKTYEVGIARFGNGDDALYCSYNYKDDYLKFGGKDNYVLSIGRSAKKIYRIDSDEGLTVYVIDTLRFGGFNIIGRQKNGNWFSYVNSKVMTDKYFNGKMAYKGSEGVVYHDGEVKVNGDTIIIPCHYQTERRSSVTESELRFKWDDKAQWFGVQHIVY